MNNLLKIFLSVIIIAFVSCKSKGVIVVNDDFQDRNGNNIISDTIAQINDTTFVNLKDYSKNFVYDLKYATTDNFLKAKVYNCAACYLRLKTVRALMNANNDAMKMGYKIKLYDCYRPLDIQKKMWAIVPNAMYVANPGTGSIHNKGAAVDITLVNSRGNELNMGTRFDFFGNEASHSYEKLPNTILQNRKILKNIMITAGFKPLDSEWWHYNLISATKDKLSNFKWTCD